MRYRLRLHTIALRQFRQLRGRFKDDVTAEIDALLSDPYPPDAKAMRGEWTGYYRLRIDGWRLVYRVDTQDGAVIIERIRRRDANTYL